MGKRERTEDCETCGGDGYLIADIVDHLDDRTDDRRPCPNCRGADAEDDVDTAKFERESYGYESDGFIERQFDFGGES